MARLLFLRRTANRVANTGASTLTKEASITPAREYRRRTWCVTTCTAPHYPTATSTSFTSLAPHLSHEAGRFWHDRTSHFSVMGEYSFGSFRGGGVRLIFLTFSRWLQRSTTLTRSLGVHYDP